MKLLLAGLVALVVVIAGGWFFLNRIESSDAQEASCHYPFRNGATQVSPKFIAEVALPDDQWGSLATALADFAHDHAWEFRDTSTVTPGVVKDFQLGLCNDSLRISVGERRWAHNNYAPPIAGRGVSVVLYGDVPESEWHPVARGVVRRLESQWPDKVRFRDRDGDHVERPSFLDGAERDARQEAW